jgi:hypothetical protein
MGEQMVTLPNSNTTRSANKAKLTNFNLPGFSLQGHRFAKFQPPQRLSPHRRRNHASGRLRTMHPPSHQTPAQTYSSSRTNMQRSCSNEKVDFFKQTLQWGPTPSTLIAANGSHFQVSPQEWSRINQIQVRLDTHQDQGDQQTQ